MVEWNCLHISRTSVQMMRIQGWFAVLIVFVLLKAHLLMASTATIFTTIDGGSHSETNASTAYWANVKQMIAI